MKSVAHCELPNWNPLCTRRSRWCGFALGACLGASDAGTRLTSCQRKTIVRTQIQTISWQNREFSPLNWSSLKISVRGTKWKRKEDSFQQFFNLFMALWYVHWDRILLGVIFEFMFQNSFIWVGIKFFFETSQWNSRNCTKINQNSNATSEKILSHCDGSMIWRRVEKRHSVGFVPLISVIFGFIS